MTAGGPPPFRRPATPPGGGPLSVPPRLPLRPALLAAALIAGGAGAAVAAPDPAANPEAQTQKKLEEVRQELERSRQEQETLSKTAGSLSAEVEDLRTRLVAAAAKVQDYEESLSYLETRMADLTREETELRGSLEARNAQMAQVLTALQRLSWRPKETMLMQPGSPEDTVRSALLMRSAVPALGSEAEALRRDLARLTDVREAITAQRDQIAALGTEFEAEHARLQDLVARKAQLVEQTTRRSAEAAQKAQALSEEAENMREFLTKLAEERKRREEELARQRALEEARRVAAHVAQKPAPPPERTFALPQPKPLQPPPSAAETVTASGGAMPPPPAGATTPRPAPGVTQAALRPLSDMRGAMPLPARGTVSTRFGAETTPGNTSKGIVIETRPAATVVAPADGMVAFSGPFRGYGHLLILEHADGYHTLLSGMSRIDAQVGQRLLAGEPVGVMERSDAPSLYVELRRDGQPIDPLPWLSAKKGKISG